MHAVFLGLCSSESLPGRLGDASVNGKVSKHNSTARKQNGPCFKPSEPRHFQIAPLTSPALSSALARPSVQSMIRLFCRARGKSVLLHF